MRFRLSWRSPASLTAPKNASSSGRCGAGVPPAKSVLTPSGACGARNDTGPEVATAPPAASLEEVRAETASLRVSGRLCASCSRSPVPIRFSSAVPISVVSTLPFFLSGAGAEASLRPAGAARFRTTGAAGRSPGAAKDLADRASGCWVDGVVCGGRRTSAVRSGPCIFDSVPMAGGSGKGARIGRSLMSCTKMPAIAATAAPVIPNAIRGTQARGSATRRWRRGASGFAQCRDASSKSNLAPILSPRVAKYASPGSPAMLSSERAASIPRRDSASLRQSGQPSVCRSTRRRSVPESSPSIQASSSGRMSSQSLFIVSSGIPRPGWAAARAAPAATVERGRDGTSPCPRECRASPRSPHSEAHAPRAGRGSSDRAAAAGPSPRTTFGTPPGAARPPPPPDCAGDRPRSAPSSGPRRRWRSSFPGGVSADVETRGWLRS